MNNDDEKSKEIFYENKKREHSFSLHNNTKYEYECLIHFHCASQYVRISHLLMF